jgi:hypothetical protein
MLLYSKDTKDCADITYKIQDDRLILGDDEWYSYHINEHINKGSIQIFNTNRGEFIFVDEEGWSKIQILNASMDLPKSIDIRASEGTHLVCKKSDLSTKNLGKIFSIKNIRKNTYSVKLTNGHIINFKII